MTKLSNNQISMAGEFAVLSQLALRGYDANLTLGNTKGVDVLVSNPQSGNMYRVEVKTTTSKASKGGMFGPVIGWQMGGKHESLNDPNLFFVFVQLDGSNYRFFIVPSVDVATHCYEEHQHWLTSRKQNPNVKFYDNDRRTFHIGMNNEYSYQVKTITAAESENRWDLLS